MNTNARPEVAALRGARKPVAKAEVAGAPSDANIYDCIISAILDHNLPPGTKLVEDKLAAAFGVSRTRIHPVLVRLAHEQIVRLTPNRGASITLPTADEAREVFGVRHLIEPTLVELFVARASAADIQALRDCVDQEESNRLAGNVRRAIRLSGEFHLIMAGRTGHQTLTRIMRELTARTTLCLMTFSKAHERESREATECGCREHRGLIDAIDLRDTGEATMRMRMHLKRLESELSFDKSNSALDLAGIFGSA